MERHLFSLKKSMLLPLFLPGLVFAQNQGGDQAAGALIVGIGTVDEVYQRWAGEDDQLSVDEWDRAVDQMFGEDPVNLDVTIWDRDGSGRISKQEFAEAITKNDTFYTAELGEAQSAQNAQGSGSQSTEQDSALNASNQQGGTNNEPASPYEYPDDSFITLSGTVESVSPDSFVLSYGDGQMVVEMDDGDRDADAYALLEGDKVTVTGVVDDDFFELQTIEAASVHVDKIDTWFYASAIDEEDYDVVSVTALNDTNEPILSVQGRVAEVNGDEFTLGIGTRDIRVEVDELPDNPLDDEGYLRLEPGDVISVRGQIDNDFLEGRELVADSLVKIHNNAI